MNNFWTAPLLLLAHLARQRAGERGLIVWIGRRLWPQPQTLLRGAPGNPGAPGDPGDDRQALHRTLLVDPPPSRGGVDGEGRLWAIDLCLRSPAVSVVVADASGMKLAHSRRLQLAAESGGGSGGGGGSGSGGALALLARPDHELAIPSAAATRWRITRIASPTTRPRWQVQLVRCKGVQRFTGMEAHASLFLEHDRATGRLHLPADLADRSNQAARSAATTKTRRIA